MVRPSLNVVVCPPSRYTWRPASGDPGGIRSGPRSATLPSVAAANGRPVVESAERATRRPSVRPSNAPRRTGAEGPGVGAPAANDPVSDADTGSVDPGEPDSVAIGAVRKGTIEETSAPIGEAAPTPIANAANTIQAVDANAAQDFGSRWLARRGPFTHRGCRRSRAPPTAMTPDTTSPSDRVGIADENRFRSPRGDALCSRLHLRE